jgi:hypothetical protein
VFSTRSRVYRPPVSGVLGKWQWQAGRERKETSKNHENLRVVGNLTEIRNECQLPRYYLRGNIDVAATTTDVIWKTQYSSPVKAHTCWKIHLFLTTIFHWTWQTKTFSHYLNFLEISIVSLAFCVFRSWRTAFWSQLICCADVLTKVSITDASGPRLEYLPRER